MTTTLTITTMAIATMHKGINSEIRKVALKTNTMVATIKATTIIVLEAIKTTRGVVMAAGPTAPAVQVLTVAAAITRVVIAVSNVVETTTGIKIEVATRSIKVVVAAAIATRTMAPEIKTRNAIDETTIITTPIIATTTLTITGNTKAITRTTIADNITSTTINSNNNSSSITIRLRLNTAAVQTSNISLLPTTSSSNSITSLCMYLVVAVAIASTTRSPIMARMPTSSRSSPTLLVSTNSELGSTQAKYYTKVLLTSNNPPNLEEWRTYHTPELSLPKMPTIYVIVA